MRAAAGSRRHPRLYWSAVVVAVLLIGGGVAVAGLGYASSSGPQAVVRGYFAALARGDAPAALAYGPVPDGPRSLVTSRGLREQRRIAPISELSIVSTRRTGNRATTRVTYELGFAHRPRRVSDSVPLQQVNGSWRLVHSAVATQLSVTNAARRATVLGKAVPEGTVLLFPGATPLGYDTDALQLDPRSDHVGFDPLPTTQVDTQVSAAGRREVLAAVTRALTACLSGGTDPRCPEPTERYVPGSLRGRIVGALDREVTVLLGTSDLGRFVVAGSVRIDASYRRLTFRNALETGHAQLSLSISAATYATTPMTIVWDRA